MNRAPVTLPLASTERTLSIQAFHSSVEPFAELDLPRGQGQKMTGTVPVPMPCPNVFIERKER